IVPIKARSQYHTGHHPRKRVIQYSRAVIELTGLGVLDSPLSRGMTAYWGERTGLFRRVGFRGRAGGRRRGRGLRGGGLLFHDADGDDRALVEAEQGY